MDVHEIKYKRSIVLGYFTNQSAENDLSDLVLTSLSEDIDKLSDGEISKRIFGWRDLSRPEHQIMIFSNVKEKSVLGSVFPMVEEICLVDLGSLHALEEGGIYLKFENIRKNVRRACSALCQQYLISSIEIDPCNHPKIVAEAALYGIFHRNEIERNIPVNSFFFDADSNILPICVRLLSTENCISTKETFDAFGEGIIIGECQNFARFLHGAGFYISREEFMKHIEEKFSGISNVKIITSPNSFFMTGNKQPVHLIQNISGGASIIATILALARLQVPVKVTGIIAVNQHSFSWRNASSIKCESEYDIFSEVPDSHEERLILKDAVSYSCSFEPEIVVTVATQTNFLPEAFQTHTSVIYSTEDSIAKLFLRVCCDAGEKFIMLPFAESEEEIFDRCIIQKQFCSDCRDILNKPIPLETRNQLTEYISKEYDFRFLTSYCLKDLLKGYRWLHLEINKDLLFHENDEDEVHELHEITDNLLQKDLLVVRLKHPRTNSDTLCAVDPSNKLYEIVQYKEDISSWLIEDSVSDDGSLFFLTVADPLFFILSYANQQPGKYCPIEDLLMDENFPDTHYLSKCCSAEDLRNIFDFKESAGYKVFSYNKTKALHWLQKKAKNVATRLASKDIDLSDGSKAASLQSSEESKSKEECLIYSCHLLSEYLSDELTNELFSSLGLKKTSEKDKTEASEEKTKKKNISVKPEDDYSKEFNINGLQDKQKKKLTAAQKQLMKVDKTGMKSISSFFKKK